MNALNPAQKQSITRMLGILQESHTIIEQKRDTRLSAILVTLDRLIEVGNELITNDCNQAYWYSKVVNGYIVSVVAIVDCWLNECHNKLPHVRNAETAA